METRTFLVLVAILFVLLGANGYFAVTSIENRSWFWLCMHLLGTAFAVCLIFATNVNRSTTN
jgi:hypothetical protein